MKFHLLNRNKTIKAKDNQGFIKKLRTSDIQDFKNNLEFMEYYSKRKQRFENCEIRFDTEEHFVEDLQKHEIIRIEKKRLF